ncbi:MAG TPA: hypothetical protein VLA19_11490 [Herpetosiphonaceae bacterium]|nr:hypothetical protein [Herpetosiphonaceae bacterium]
MSSSRRTRPPNPFNFRDKWLDVSDNMGFDNAFERRSELFLRHVASDEPFPRDLFQDVNGVQLAELGLQAWRDRCWEDLLSLTL